MATIKLKTNTRIMMSVFAGLIGSIIIFTAPVLTAQNSSENLVDVSQCVGLPDAAERLSCFDKATAHLQNRPGKEPLPVASLPRSQPPTAVIEPPENNINNSGDIAGNNEIAEFGRSSSTSRVLESDDGVEELFDRVASLRKRAPNLWAITLESGQVWFQSNSQFFRLSEGDDVKIYPSPLGGSFRLRRMDMNGFIQVERAE